MKKISLLLLLPALFCCVSCEPKDDGGKGTDQAVESTAKAKPESETAKPAPEPVQKEKDAVPAAKLEYIRAQPQAAAQKPVVTMLTSKGPIVIELYADKAPITVANFLSYVKSGFYDGTVFHRIIPNFMIQGGGMTPAMQKKPTQSPIKNESYNKLRNARGTIAMARTNAPDSATSQFFINHVDNRSLDFDGPMAPGYAVFGKVIEGMDVVDAIAAAVTQNIGPYRNVPVEPIIIESVTIK